MRLIRILKLAGVLFFTALSGCTPFAPTTDLRLNQIQVIGTHNSYHLRGHNSLLALIAAKNPKERDELDYAHRPLREQLSRFGIRQIELDCFADPHGGLYAKPLGIELVRKVGLPPAPEYDPAGRMHQPGIKVMHLPDIDFASSTLTLVDALRQVREWSLKNPRHVPVFILLELKEEGSGKGFTQPVPFDEIQLANLEKEILSVFPRPSILKPDDVRGEAATLPEALRRSGWPLLDAVRGRVMFGLDNEDAVRDRYLEKHPALEGRLAFVSVPPTNAAAAWMKRNDVIGNFEEIQDLVKSGFLVRTRADSDTLESRLNDPRKRDRALASGAQFVSTDYPEPDLRWSRYCVRLPAHASARTNPLNYPNQQPGKIME